MNNEGLEYEIQELGAGGDNMLLTFFFFFLCSSKATVKQAEASLWLTCTSFVT